MSGKWQIAAQGQTAARTSTTLHKTFWFWKDVMDNTWKYNLGITDEKFVILTDVVRDSWY